MTGQNQAVFYTKLFAKQIEHMLIARLLLFAASREAVGELIPVVEYIMCF